MRVRRRYWLMRWAIWPTGAVLACGGRAVNNGMGRFGTRLGVFRAQHGFTLLELLVVIVIIGMLAAYVGPKYFAQLSKSEVELARTQIVSFEKALDTFRLDVGRYPTTEEGLTALVAPPAAALKWNGPYLNKVVPLDPWSHPYQYKSPGATSDFDIVSLGRDGQAGGTGLEADIRK